MACCVDFAAFGVMGLWISGGQASCWPRDTGYSHQGVSLTGGTPRSGGACGSKQAFWDYLVYVVFLSTPQPPLIDFCESPVLVWSSSSIDMHTALSQQQQQLRLGRRQVPCAFVFCVTVPLLTATHTEFADSRSHLAAPPNKLQTQAVCNRSVFIAKRPSVMAAAGTLPAGSS